MSESLEFETSAKELEEWDERHAHLSFSTHQRCPAYPIIIAMGMPVVPLILMELRRNMRWWMLSALHEITKANPVPEKHRGRVSKMKDDWIRWGEKNGYLPAK